MLTAFRRWIGTAWGRAEEAPDGATAVLDGPLAAPARAAASEIPTAPALAEAALHASLRSELERRVAAARNWVGPAAHQPDAHALLDALLADEELVVRQLPSAAQEALALCQNPMLGFARIEPLFRKDPTLMQGVLRAANSAAQGGERLVALMPAIARIGTGGVRNVVLGATVQGMLCRPGSLYGRMVALTWEHMARTGPIARALAPAFRVDEDQAFTLGLLHDVGKLVIFDAATALRRRLQRDLAMSPVVLGELLRTLHEPMGGLAALRWNLGAEPAQAIATHHRNPAPAGPDLASEVIYIAERFDLAAVRGGEIDLDAAFAGGEMTVSRTLVEFALPDAAAARAGM